MNTYVTAAITNTLCCDLILGEDWIQRYKVTKVLGDKARIPLRVQPNETAFPIQVQSSIVIPARAQRLIRTVTPIACTEKVMFSKLKGIRNFAMESLIVQNYDNAIELTVTNVNDQPVYLAGHTDLGVVYVLGSEHQ